jgi:phosphate uptake regulator
MKRKIVKQGVATMTISLPASWIKQMELSEGAEINLEEDGNRIIISSGKSEEKKTVEYNIKEKGVFTKSDLSHLYILGYDEIIIKYNDKQVLKDIKDRLPDCIGLEIIDQQNGKVVIKGITSALEEEFDNILRKVFIILKDQAEEVYTSLKEGRFSDLEELREMEAINNKFTSFLLRLIVKKGYKDFSRNCQAYDMIQNLERISDEYKYICDSFKEQKKPIDKDALGLLKEINEYYEVFYEAFYKFDSNKRNKMYDARKTLKDKAFKMLEKNKEPILAHHLINLSEKITNTTGSFLALIKK